MARPTGPTIARWQLKEQLLILREAAGCDYADAAAVLACSESKIRKMEAGVVAVSRGDLVLLLDLYKTPEPMRGALLDLQRQGRERGWWARFGHLPAPYVMYIGLESAAIEVRNYELAVIPGLLQTERYARAIISAQRAGDPIEEIQRRVQVRIARQACLRDAPVLQLWTIIDESALRRRIGDPGVMREQLDYLIEASTLPNVTIQVLPFSEGEHPGTLGSLAILDFPEDVHSPVVYLETYAGDVYLEQEDDMRRAISTYTHLQASAASSKDSVDLIGRIGSETTNQRG